MKMTSVTTMMVSLAAIMLFASGSTAQAGQTAEKLERAGYFCFNAGPSNFKHCLLLRHSGNPVIPLKIFSPNGSEFLGTELLLREDIYAGQPCPQDGIDPWDFLGENMPYFACHHFHTHHND